MWISKYHSWNTDIKYNIIYPVGLRRRGTRFDQTMKLGAQALCVNNALPLPRPFFKVNVAQRLGLRQLPANCI